MQQGKGYVWVFTNLEEVVYMFRPNREGDFLRELLKDFHGVVVSDFYAAYDALACPQQKCLIHLMRDLNQELLDNPYDDELKAITHPFGSMLRAIIDTIDQHGLQQRYLAKHHTGDHELLSVAHRAVVPLRSSRGAAGTAAQVSGEAVYVYPL